MMVEFRISGTCLDFDDLERSRCGKKQQIRHFD